MAQNLGPIDLTTATVGQVIPVDWQKTTGQSASSANYGPEVVLGATGRGPKLQFFNESGVGLEVLFGTGESVFIPAGGWMQWPLKPECTSLTLTVQYIIPNAPVSLLNLIYYQPYETPPEIPALGNSPVGIGGNVVTSNVQSLTNDGNPAPTSIIEATPSGQGSSSWAVNNDGSGFLQVLSANVLRKVWNVTRGDTGATKAVIQFGDSGDLTITTYSGKLTQISSDGGKITSDGAGNLASTATIAVNPASVPGATTSFIFAKVGADTTGRVSLGIRSDGGGNVRLGNDGTAYGVEIYTDGTNCLVQTATFILSGGLKLVASSAGQELGSTSVANTPHLDFHSSGNNIDYDSRIIAAGGTTGSGAGTLEAVSSNFFLNSSLTVKPSGVGLILANLGLGANGAAGASLARGINGTETDVELTSIGQTLSLNSDQGFYIKYNNYWNGTNDKFIATASGQAWQFFVSSNGPQARFSTNTPTTGANITWSGFQNVASMASAGGGAAGNTEWIGTTDPGTAAGEGDTWVPA